jgi:MFS family permease
MSITLLVTLSALIAVVLVGRNFVHLPKNVWLLFLAQPLAMTSSSMIVFAGGLVSTKIAPTADLATLPLTLMILGTAAAVIPASMLMKKIGRKYGTMIGLFVAIIGALLCAYAVIDKHFYWLISGGVLLGMSIAFIAQMRFSAIESLTDLNDAPKAISVLMVGGIFAAVLGPEIAVTAKDWLFPQHPFSGSFFALGALLACAILLISQLDPIHVQQEKVERKPRSLIVITRQPLFIIAVCAGAFAYAVMSYVMTASPLSMHEIHGHNLSQTKWVIQSHIIAMYLPSLFSAFLVRKFGIAKLMLVGCFMYALVVIIALSGHQVMHYWWTMVLLGIGWNFLFTSGTLLLPTVYQADERFKVQAVNDFSIFFFQAMASLSAGLILFNQGWDNLIMIVIPIITIMVAISIWYYTAHKKQAY